MNLHEIEATIKELSLRHQPLDEITLVTLLRAGGWEEKDIEDAKTLFRGGVSSALKGRTWTQQQIREDTEKALPNGNDSSHLLMERTEDVPSVIGSEEAKGTEMSHHVDPVSLIEVNHIVEKDAIPHNLPLRPFETSEHVWPFSRYRDVFYGGEDDHLPPSVTPHIASPPPPPEPVAPPVPIPEPVQSIPVVPPPVETPAVEVPPQEEEIEIPPPIAEPVYVEPVVVTPVIPPVSPAPVELPLPTPTKPSSPSKSHIDENLVILACFMLFLVLLLLGYMYSNGRL